MTQCARIAFSLPIYVFNGIYRGAVSGLSLLAPIDTAGDMDEADQEAALRKTESVIQSYTLRTERLERQKREFSAILQTHVAGGNRKKALPFLRKIRGLEKQIDKHRNVMATLETQMDAMRDNQVMAPALSVMENNVQHLRKMVKTTNPDEVDRMMTDVEKTLEDADGVSEIIGSKVRLGPETDDDLEAELDAYLAQSDAVCNEPPPNEPMLRMPSTPKLNGGQDALYTHMPRTPVSTNARARPSSRMASLLSPS